MHNYAAKQFKDLQTNGIVDSDWEVFEQHNGGGQGSICAIRKPADKTNQRIFKCLKSSGKDNIERFIREVNVVAEIDHPNIVKYLDWSNRFPYWHISKKGTVLSSLAGIDGGTRLMESESKEEILLGKIEKTPVGAERDRLIDELESVPETRYMRTFYERWLFVHDVYPFWDCWSDCGYDPSKSIFPRDVQILAASDYGKSDIDNGGFHQFFGNSTGVFAPEMVEWLDSAGLTKAANVVQEAMDVFGPEFPRPRFKRTAFLAKFQGDSHVEWEPFYNLDDRFSDATDDEIFRTAGNSWLRETCGIKRLRDVHCKG